ncbi:MAG: penicillin-binding transpeptidase domain-containing protein [Terriglobales bacterium]
MKNGSAILRLILVFLVAGVLTLCASAASISSKSVGRLARSKSASVTENSRTQKRMSRMRQSRRVTRASVRRRRARRARRVRYYERFSTSSFADDVTVGDVTAGEDPVVRQAAIEALGNMNGTVLAIDPASGRILAMVNQKMALSAGATPCSTIKIPVALAALSENLITKDTKVPLGKRWSMDLTTAMAHSNNAYFEVVGRRLGFEKYSYYAHQFGLGELAGWNIPGENLGTFPNEPLAEKLGGVGKMCSFGESIHMTPLQLGALVSAIANGGTLYYLQHPTTVDEIVNFQPKVKRHLDIGPVLSDIFDGMAGAVNYGTAKSVRWSFSEEPVLGKTGTCSNNAGTRYGWFASYANTEFGRIVTVVFLEGGRPTYGPKAAEIAGRMYRNLYDHSFFNAKPLQPTNTAERGRAVVGAPQ